MIHPIKSPLLSTNQIKNNILGVSGTLQREEEQIVYNIKNNFYRNPDYTQVKKNFDNITQYDVWIYDGNKEDKNLGSYKELYSYPYNPHVFEIGDYISFNYGGDIHNWLITSLDKKLYYDIKGRIERCNIDLKWKDQYGNLISYPAVAPEELLSTVFDFNNNIIINQGRMKIKCQFNDKTKTIKINDRFLLGDPYQAFKVISLDNYTNTNGFSFDVMVDNISSNDDLINGIANFDTNNYTISIDQGNTLSQNIGYETQLSATIKNNDEIVNEPIIWATSDENICTIDSSGNIELIAEGNCIITAIMKNNSLIRDTITINVVATTSGIIKIEISPLVTSILQAKSQTYTVVKTLDDVNSSEVLNIQDITTNIPSGYYTFTSGLNTFTISNLKMFTSYPVKIKVSDGLGNENEIDIKLKGAW